MGVVALFKQNAMHYHEKYLGPLRSSRDNGVVANRGSTVYEALKWILLRRALPSQAEVMLVSMALKNCYPNLFYIFFINHQLT